MSGRLPRAATGEERAASTLTLDQATAIRLRACRTKSRHNQGRAMKLADERRARGEQVAAYRCPFGCGTWHVGHVPNLRSVADLAAAVRILAGNGPGRDRRSA